MGITCTSPSMIRGSSLYSIARWRHVPFDGMFTVISPFVRSFFFFFNDTATTEIYTLSLHDALPISSPRSSRRAGARPSAAPGLGPRRDQPVDRQDAGAADHDRQGHRDQRQVELVAVAQIGRAHV